VARDAADRWDVRYGQIWKWWLAAGIIATGGYFLLPKGLAQNIGYNAIGLVSSVVIVLAVRLHRPERPRMWYWFAAGQIVWVLGDVTWEYYQHVLHEEPFPSYADAFYLSAYPLIVIGMVALLRGHGRRDLAGLVDASIVATGLGLVFWAAVIHPIAADSSATTLERVIGVAYPAGDALVLAMLARLFTGPGARTPSHRLLGLAVVLLLLADVGFAVLSLYAEYESGFLDAGWLLSYVIWAAAALHPSMRAVGTRAAGTGLLRMTRGRMALLAGSSLLAPGLLFVPTIGGNTVDRIAIATGAVVLFLLVIARMSGFTGQVQRQAGLLEDLAMRDDLTGLANRRRFEQGIRDALVGGRPQVILLDLNGFKAVNDDLGHSVGDRLLVVLARRLAFAVRADSLVARMGGDEFAVLLPDADAADAAVVVDRLTGALREPVPAGPHELLVAASIGSADGAGTDDPFEVLRRADVAMYAAKQRGERHRRYAPDLDEQASAQAVLGAELRTALDAGQFRLVYQPIVELPHGRIVAVETLVRWAHPERGEIGPIGFIEVAEQNGLIVELGAWILRTACRQAAQWRAEYGADAPSRISVNVSARQLAQPGFATVVAAALADSGLPAACLAVEVTETAVFEGGPALVALHELRALGVRIALDDFGTGHSSLGLLQTVPVDILKVDKSFVDNITMAGRHAVIATSLIDIGNGLGLVAVAEGVETAEQAAELYRIGYRYAQGYHFGRPVPEPVFPRARRADAAALPG
jgi:diguanylate cyclase (GGDEF)-like protein